METPRILMVLTSATRMGSYAEPTGTWLEEVAAPYYTFLDAKCEVTLASPAGGVAPVDPNSLKPENTSAATRRFEADADAQKAMANTQTLGQLDLESYDALFFPGGHGTMEDLPTDASVKAAVEHFYAEQKPLAAVCHGPAAFVSATKPNGEPLMAGHHFTCFTNEEETLVELADKVPFLLESRLKEQGGMPSTAAPFVSHVVIQGALVTGQNPASSIPAAEAVIHQLRGARLIAA